MTNSTWKNVVRGVAIGDAWGDPVEFRKIASIIKDDLRGPDMPDRMRITDDTQMTLFLADALDLTSEASVADTQAAIEKAFLAYHGDPDTGSRAPGVTVMGSLGGIARGAAWQKATNRTSDGSGTVMRTSPVAFVSDDRWVGVAAFAAAITHGSANGIAAAILNVAVLRAIMAGKVSQGNTIDAARVMASDPASYGLLNVGEWLDGYDVDIEPGFAELARLLDIAAKALPELQASPWGAAGDPSLKIGGGGWRAHECLAIALLACDTFPNDPWSSLRRSAATDGDSDTIAAVTGALLGALYPTVFIEEWGQLRDRFEPRYVAWIENEADHYQFAPERTSWLKRLLRR